MALQKKDENRVNAKICGKLSLITAIVLLVIGVIVWKAGDGVVTTVNKGIMGEKIVFPPEGAPGFNKTTYPNAFKYAGQKVEDGKLAKVFAEDYIGVQMKAVGGGKTGFELSAMAAADPGNAGLQQLQTVMFQMGTSKTLLMSAYGGWIQGKVMKNVGMTMLLASVVLFIVALVELGRYKRLQ